MDNPQLNAAPASVAIPDIGPDVLATDVFDAMSDRELLLFIARNMLTPDTVVNTVQERLPQLLEALGSSPTGKILLKLLR